MFETTVKHFVYDFCIGLVFDKWKDNFVSASGDMPKVGDIFNRISHMMEDEHYYKCKVRNVVPKHTKDGKPYCLVYLNYETSSGIAVQEWEDEISEYLTEHNINIDELDEIDELIDDADLYIDDELDEYDIVDEELEAMMNDEEIEYMEYPDMICLNSLYYAFYKE